MYLYVCIACTYFIIFSFIIISMKKTLATKWDVSRSVVGILDVTSCVLYFSCLTLLCFAVLFELLIFSVLLSRSLVLSCFLSFFCLQWKKSTTIYLNFYVIFAIFHIFSWIFYNIFYIMVREVHTHLESKTFWSETNGTRHRVSSFIYSVYSIFLASIELKLKLGQKRWKAFPIWLDNQDRRHCATHSGWPFPDLWPSRAFVVSFPYISFLYGGINNEGIVRGSMKSVILSIRNFFQFYSVRWMERFPLEWEREARRQKKKETTFYFSPVGTTIHWNGRKIKHAHRFISIRQFHQFLKWIYDVRHGHIFQTNIHVTRHSNSK